MPLNICLQCSHPFQALRPTARFCSNACKQKAYRTRHRVPPFAGHCLHCGIILFCPRTNQKFCSNKCRQAEYRHNKKDDHPEA